MTRPIQVISQRVSYLVSFTKVYKTAVEFVLLVHDTASVESLIPTLRDNKKTTTTDFQLQCCEPPKTCKSVVPEFLSQRLLSRSVDSKGECNYHKHSFSTSKCRMNCALRKIATSCCINASQVGYSCASCSALTFALWDRATIQCGPDPYYFEHYWVLDGVGS
jgi:hypothetical protein